MTAYDIIRAITRSLWSPYDQVIAYNCCSLGWESDMLVVSRNHYVDEVEIKLSYADFLADFRKPEKHETLQRWRPKRVYDPSLFCFEPDWKQTEPIPIRRFWFAIPEELRAKVEEKLPDYAGLITIKPYGSRYRADQVRKAPTLRHSRKLTDEELLSLYHSMYCRVWRRFTREDI